MDDEGKDHPDPKRPPQKNHPTQLWDHIVPTDDVQNTNGTNYEGDLLLIDKSQTLPQRTERMLQENQRHNRFVPVFN